MPNSYLVLIGLCIATLSKTFAIPVDISGRVVDASVLPVQGAKVSLSGASGVGGGAITTLTGVDGKFRLTGELVGVHIQPSLKKPQSLIQKGAFARFETPHFDQKFNVMGRWEFRSVKPVNNREILQEKKENHPSDRSIAQALAKVAGIGDTLLIEKAGFQSIRIPLPNLVANVGDLSLKATVISASCQDLKLPAGAFLSIRSDDGVETNGTQVTAWANRGSAGGSFKKGDGPTPIFEKEKINGHPVVSFDGKSFLTHNIKIVGQQEMTLGMVTATTHKFVARNDWCQRDFNVPLNEHGCSGTFFNPIMWYETGDWGYTYVGPGQEHISFRFGAGAKTYQITNGKPDPGTGWTRPKSIGSAFTYTMGLKALSHITLMAEGKEVLSKYPTPGKAGPITNASDKVELGSGRTDSRDPTLIRWTGQMAEVWAYTRVLTPAEIEQVTSYVKCRYFPNGLP